MPSATFTVRAETAVKKRLDKLAKLTGRSRSSLATEALIAYLDVNEWQVAGINRAVGSLDNGASISHDAVERWIKSWDHRANGRFLGDR